MLDKERHWWVFDALKALGGLLQFGVLSIVALYLYLNHERQSKQLEIQGKQVDVQLKQLELESTEVEGKLSRSRLVETSFKLEPKLQAKPFAAAGTVGFHGLRYVSCQLLLTNIGNAPVDLGQVVLNVQHAHPPKEVTDQYKQEPNERIFECTTLHSANAQDLQWVPGETRTLDLDYSLLEGQERLISFDYIVADYWFPTWVKFTAKLTPRDEGQWEQIDVEQVVDLGELPSRPGAARLDRYEVVETRLYGGSRSGPTGELLRDVLQIPSDAIEVRKVHRPDPSDHPPVAPPQRSEEVPPVPPDPTFEEETIQEPG